MFPHMDFVNGFTLWRELGMTGNGEPLPSLALTAIHWTHRAVAIIVFALVAWVAHQSAKIGGLKKIARWLAAGIVLQFATGVLTVYLNFPLALAVIHNGGAALLVLLLVMLNYKIRLAASHPPRQS